MNKYMQHVFSLFVSIWFTAPMVMATEISGYIPPQLRHHYPDNSFTIKVADFAKDGFSGRFFHDNKVVKIDTRGYFSVTIEAPSPFFYIAFDGLIGVEGRPILYKELLLKGEGHLDIDLSSADFSFSGDLGMMMDVQLDMAKMITSRRGPTYGEWETYFEYLEQWHPKMLNSIDSLVHSFAQYLSSDAIEIILLNGQSHLSSSVTGALRYLHDDIKRKNYDQNLLDTMYNKVRTAFKRLSPDGDILKYAIAYPKAWLSIEEVNLIMDGYGINSSGIRSDSLMTSLFERIADVRDTLMRDRLLMGYFFTPGYSKNADTSRLAEAVDLATSTHIKKQMDRLKAEQSGMAKVKNFEFLDGDDRKVTIADFEGKVSIVHFWFNGCVGCRFLADFMEDVIAVYQDQEDVQFVDVNVDEEHKRWQDGLETGEYTSSHELNLWTGSVGSRHPLLETYNFVGFPQLMVIDKKGRLITAKASAFRTNKAEFKEKLSAMIEEYR